LRDESQILSPTPPLRQLKAVTCPARTSKGR